MKLKIVISTLLFALPMLAYSAENRAFFGDLRMPTEVQAAHESFLAGNFDQMALNIKRALMAYPGDLGIQRNLLDLYDKAYELKGNSAVSPDWRAPRGVTWLSIVAKKKFKPEQGSIDYRIGFSMDHELGSEVEQVKVTHFPSEVIMDKERGLGDWSDETDPAEKVSNFWMAADYRTLPNAEGLYLLDVKLKGQEIIHGWFLLSRATASESPEVSVPAINQVFATGNPTFQWKDFVSDEYRSYESRKVKLSVIRRANNVKSDTWIMRRKPPFTSQMLGAGDEGEKGVKVLPPDNYVFQVMFGERRHFGDLTISRESGTSIPFSVK